MIQDQQQQKADFEFTPRLNGTHMENCDNTAQYTGGATVQGQDSEGNPAPVQIDDGVEYQRTRNASSSLAVDNAPPSRPAPLSGQQQPEQSQQLQQPLPSSFWNTGYGNFQEQALQMEQQQNGGEQQPTANGGQDAGGEQRVPFEGIDMSSGFFEGLGAGVGQLFTDGGSGAAPAADSGSGGSW